MKKKIASVVLSFAMVVTTLSVASVPAAAAKKPSVKSKVSVTAGKTVKVAVKNAKKITKIKVAKKAIAKVVKKGKTAVKVTGKKAGSTKVTLTVTYGKNKKKSLKFTVKVAKKKVAATKAPATKAPATKTPATPTPTPVPTPTPTPKPVVNADGQLFAYKTAKAPTIDGKIDAGEWDEAPLITSDLMTRRAESGEVTDQPETSATYKVLWDDTYCYVLADVIDPTADKENGNQYERDNVEVYFNEDNNEATDYDTVDDAQIRVDRAGEITGGSNYTGWEDNTNAVMVDNGTGYVIEMAYKWANGNVPKVVGTLMGFSLQVAASADGTRYWTENFADKEATGNSYADTSIWKSKLVLAE